MRKTRMSSKTHNKQNVENTFVALLEHWKINFRKLHTNLLNDERGAEVLAALQPESQRLVVGLIQPHSY